MVPTPEFPSPGVIALHQRTQKFISLAQKQLCYEADCRDTYHRQRRHTSDGPCMRSCQLHGRDTPRHNPAGSVAALLSEQYVRGRRLCRVHCMRGLRTALGCASQFWILRCHGDALETFACSHLFAAWKDATGGSTGGAVHDPRKCKSLEGGDVGWRRRVWSSIACSDTGRRWWIMPLSFRCPAPMALDAIWSSIPAVTCASMIICNGAPASSTVPLPSPDAAVSRTASPSRPAVRARLAEH